MIKKPRLRVRVYSDLDTLKELLPAWEELLARFPGATNFCTWEWLVSWWRTFGGEQELLALGFFTDDGGLAGLAPLALYTYHIASGLKLRIIRLMGDGSGDSDNLDVPVLSGYEDELANGLLENLRIHRKSWDLCQFNALPGDSPAGSALRRHLEQRRWTHFTYSHPWSVISLPDSWEAYLKQLSNKERGKIGLRARRLEKLYKVRIFRCAEQSDLPACLDALFRLHETRWQGLGEPGSFTLPARRQFYSGVARLFLARNWLEFWLMELDGKAVAAQFGFRYKDTVYSLQEGFDPAYSSESVGYVLRGHVLKQLIARGVRRYDFLGGESPSKARWGAEVRNYTDIHFARPFTRGSLYLRLRQQLQQGKAWLRGHLPAGVWSMLHQLHLRLRGSAP